MTRVAIMQSAERSAGVRGAVAALGHNPAKNKHVLIGILKGGISRDPSQ